MATCKPAKNKYWYRQSKKWKTRQLRPKLLCLPTEVRFIIYNHVFFGKTMIDITTTEKGDYRRKYGAQSLLFVNKVLRKEAMESFYKTCIFQSVHFRLHRKHQRLNPMKSLDRIRNLHVIWTPPINSRFTSCKGDDVFLNELKGLQELTLDLRGFQYLLLDSVDDEAELQADLLKKFQGHFRNLPRWMKRLIENASAKLNIYLMVYFFAGPVATSTFFACATILWRDRNVIKVEPVDTTKWSASRKVTKEKIPKIEGPTGEMKFGRLAVMDASS